MKRKLAAGFLERQEAFEVSVVGDVRDVDMLFPHEIKVAGAFATVDDVEAPHSYMLVSRSGQCHTLVVFVNHHATLSD